MDDREAQVLIEKVLSGDAESFSPIVQAYTPALYNLAFKMGGGRDSAGDVVQETFYRAYRDLGKFDGRTRFASWLYGICVNVSYDHGKRRMRAIERERPIGDDHAEALASRGMNAEESLAASQEEGHMRDCLLKLPDTLRSALLLRYQEDLPVGEVAGQLKIGLSAAKMRIQRGLEMLRGFCAEGARGGIS
jgi:RNA polymerase sigma-70 factor (ECF subfamily)